MIKKKHLILLASILMAGTFLKTFSVSRADAAVSSSDHILSQNLNFETLGFEQQKFLKNILSSRDPNLMVRYSQWYSRKYCSGRECTVGPARLAQFIFDNDLSIPQKVSVACISSKLLQEFLWLKDKNVIFDKIVIVGESSSLGLTLQDHASPDRLKNYLLGHGYTRALGASFGHDWGLRSRAGGPQLHWAHEKGEPMNLYIDLNNPKEGAELEAVVNHFRRDLINRSSIYTPETIVNSFADRCGFSQYQIF